MHTASLEDLRAARPTGAHEHTLSFKSLSPGDATTLLSSIRAAGFAPAPEFRGGLVDGAGIAYSITLLVTL